MNYGGWTNFRDSWEYNVLQYVKKQKKTPICFDVGGNIGWYTLCCDSIFEGAATIHTFEPSKTTFQEMEKNIGTKPNIYCHNIGLGDMQKEVNLYSQGSLSGEASVFKRNLEHININFDHEEKIQISTIDNFCSENKITDITLLKLDIEWGEYNALSWAKWMLTGKHIQYIQFEFGWTGIDARIYFKDFWDLLSHDYSIYRILPRWLYKIDKYEEVLEIFFCVNFFCELKTPQK